MQGTIDKYEELFVIVSYLLEEGSLNADSAEIKEFNGIMELALEQASIALIKIIRKSDIATWNTGGVSLFLQAAM